MTAEALSARGGFPLRRLAASIALHAGSLANVLGGAIAARREAERLYGLGDRGLAELGMTREDIPRAVFDRYFAG